MEKLIFCEKAYQRAIQKHIKSKEERKRNAIKSIESEVCYWLQLTINDLITRGRSNPRFKYIYRSLYLEDKVTIETTEDFLRQLTKQANLLFVKARQRLQSPNGVLLILKFDPLEETVTSYQTRGWP